MAVNLEVRKKLPVGASVFEDSSFDNSIIGVSLDGRLIYSFEKMVQEYMMDNNCDELCAIEWIEHNTLRALPYWGNKAPIVVYTYETQ